MLARATSVMSTQALEREASQAALRARRPGAESTRCGACGDHACQCSPGKTGATNASGPRSHAALPPSTRRRFEASFGYDFSAVRIHADGASAAAAQREGARAYTQGPNIHFGAGEYSPETSAGSDLLAHELAHVVQQGAARPLNGVSPPLPLTRVGRTMTQRMALSGSTGAAPQASTGGAGASNNNPPVSGLPQALQPGPHRKEGENDPCPQFTMNAMARLLGFHHIRLREGPDKADRLTFLGCNPRTCYMEFASGAGAAVSFAKYPYYLLASTLYKRDLVRCSYDFKCEGQSIRFGPGSCPG